MYAADILGGDESFCSRFLLGQHHACCSGIFFSTEGDLHGRRVLTVGCVVAMCVRCSHSRDLMRDLPLL